MERIFSPEAEVEESVTKPGKHVMLHELQWR